MKNLYLYQPQLAHGESYWMPYSLGTIWSYALTSDIVKNDWTLKEMLFDREDYDSVLKRLENPAVCGFSSYIWNHEYNIQLAFMIKNTYPDCVIVFGGPNAHADLLNEGFIDIIVTSEGEKSFKYILESISNGKIPNGTIELGRLEAEELCYPSPYLTGVFDDLIAANPDKQWRAILETNRGCPYQCTFCDWGGATYSKIRKFDLERVFQEIDWMCSQNVINIMISDANFGILKERDTIIAKKIAESAEGSKLKHVTLNFAKNSNETIFEIGKILEPFNEERGVNVSHQSLNPDTLAAIKRKNMDVHKMDELLSKVDPDVHMSTHLLLPLPLETLETWKNGLAIVMEKGYKSMLIWFTEILKNSEMADPEYRKQYGLKTKLVSSYNNTHVKEFNEIVIATNTMTTEELVEGFLYAFMVHFFFLGDYGSEQIKYVYEHEGAAYRDILDCVFEEMMKSEFFITQKDALTRFFAGKALRREVYESVKSIPHQPHKEITIKALEQKYVLPDHIKNKIVMAYIPAVYN